MQPPLQQSRRQASHPQSNPVQKAFQEMQRHVGGHGYEKPGRGGDEGLVDPPPATMDGSTLPLWLLNFS
jgi:hypothetical protein